MPRNLDGVAEETTESFYAVASEPVMEKAVAKIPREATQTAVEDLPALNFQSTEVTAVENAEESNCAAQVASKDMLKMSMEVKAEHAEQPEDTPQDESPVDGDRVLVPMLLDENAQVSPGSRRQVSPGSR